MRIRWLTAVVRRIDVTYIILSVIVHKKRERLLSLRFRFE
jgi:hypothetical protein